jgi:uncharacterized membrane protein
MYKFTKQILVAAFVMLALDFLYLSINKANFENQVIGIQKVVMQVRYAPAILCYAFLISGLAYFILRQHRPVTDAFLLGVFVYGVFDLTNSAIFKKWSPYLAMMDTLWGGVLMAATTQVVYTLV